MKRFGSNDVVARGAAIAAATGFAAIALFQLALAAGVPLGHAAWGGAHAHLVTGERIGSAVSILIWSCAALIVLGRAGLLATRVGPSALRRGMWTLVAVSVIAALMNFASHSVWEQLIFGPTALLLATLCTIVARSGLERKTRRTSRATPASPPTPDRPGPQSCSSHHATA
jgi:hypothetical protein